MNEDLKEAIKLCVQAGFTVTGANGENVSSFANVYVFQNDFRGCYDGDPDEVVDMFLRSQREY